MVCYFGEHWGRKATPSRPTDNFSSLSPVLFLAVYFRTGRYVHKSIARRKLIAVPYALGQAALPYFDSCLSVISKVLNILSNDRRSDEEVDTSIKSEARES